MLVPHEVRRRSDGLTVLDCDDVATAYRASIQSSAHLHDVHVRNLRSHRAAFNAPLKLCQLPVPGSQSQNTASRPGSARLPSLRALYHAHILNIIKDCPMKAGVPIGTTTHSSESSARFAAQYVHKRIEQTIRLAQGSGRF